MLQDRHKLPGVEGARHGLDGAPWRHYVQAVISGRLRTARQGLRDRGAGQSLQNGSLATLGDAKAPCPAGDLADLGGCETAFGNAVKLPEGGEDHAPGRQIQAHGNCVGRNQDLGLPITEPPGLVAPDLGTESAVDDGDWQASANDRPETQHLATGERHDGVPFRDLPERHR